MWLALMEPGVARHIDPDLIDAGRLPGSPSGLGELQYFITATEDGKRCSVLEVQGYDHLRRAEIRDLTGVWPGGYEVTLTEVSEQRWVVRHDFWLTIPAGAAADLVAASQAHLDNSVARIAAALPGAISR